MNIKQAIALSGLVAAAACISPLALAQDWGWYLGASGGQSDVKDFCQNPVPVGTSCDNTGSSYTVFGGLQFNKFLGVELGYTDISQNKASDAVTTVTWKVKGVELLGVGSLPVNQYFEVYGKVGVFFWDLDDGCTGAPCTFSSRSETGADLTYGFGAQVNFSKSVAARAQYQRYKDVGNEATTGTSDINILSLGILFRF